VSQARELQQYLFSGDTERIGNTTVAEVLDAPLRWRQGTDVAVVSMGWRGGLESGSGQQLHEALEAGAATYAAIGRLAAVPRLLMNERLTVPVLRELGVRLRCEGVLIYQAWQSDRYRWRLLDDDEGEAVLTIEGTLLHVRSGCVPFTASVDQRVLVRRMKDESTYDMMLRAQRLCLQDGLRTLGARLGERLDALSGIAAVSPAQTPTIR
jgi:hypothetical protein